MTTGNVSTTNRISSKTEPLKRLAENVGIKLRVAAPGIIKAFNVTKQTVEVQLCIREKLTLDGKPYEDVEIPILKDVPIFMPRAGNFVLTMPIAVDDECLVIFADNCIDGWWESGKVSNQLDRRRHDLSDGFAILGVWSQPNVISDYSVDSAVLRNLNNDSYVEVKDTIINIKTTSTINAEASTINAEATTINATASNEAHVTAPIVNMDCDSHRLTASSGSIEDTGAVKNITATTINLTGSGGVIINGGGSSAIDNKPFLSHTHTAPSGGGVTSGVN